MLAFLTLLDVTVYAGPWAAICWGVCTSAAVATCMTTCVLPSP